MKISARDIMELHPKMMHCASDFYYARVANEIKDALAHTRLDENEEYVRKEFALKLTMYLEDVVSEAGVWDTFVRLHRRMYGRPLPFFDVPDGYSSSDITKESVALLVWLTMMNVYEGQRIFNPDNPGLQEIAELALPILHRYSKKAPVNESLLDMLYGDDTLDDFMEIKKVLMWLSEQCYLSEWVGVYVYKSELEERLEEVLPDISPNMLEYTVSSICALSQKTTILALLPQQWYAEMLRGYNEDELGKVASEIEHIEYQKFGIFHVDGYDDVHVRLMNKERQLVSLRRDSVEKNLSSKELEGRKTFVGSMALWKGEWQLVGMSAWSDDENMYSEALENEDNVKNVYMLPPEALKKLKGERLFFFKNYKHLSAWLKKILKISWKAEDMEEAVQMENILVFIEDNGAMSIAPNGACGVKSPSNPCYSPVQAPTEALRLLLSTESSTSEMSRYLAENGLLPDACLNSIISKERGLQLVQENMDFMARCLRRCGY